MSRLTPPTHTQLKIFKFYLKIGYNVTALLMGMKLQLNELKCIVALFWSAVEMGFII